MTLRYCISNGSESTGSRVSRDTEVSLLEDEEEWRLGWRLGVQVRCWCDGTPMLRDERQVNYAAVELLPRLSDLLPALSALPELRGCPGAAAVTKPRCHPHPAAGSFKGRV